MDAGHLANPFCVVNPPIYSSYPLDPDRLTAHEVILLRKLWASYDNVKKVALHRIITNFKKGITNAPVPCQRASLMTPGCLEKLVDAGDTCRRWMAAYDTKFGWVAQSRMISKVRAAYRAAIQQ